MDDFFVLSLSIVREPVFDLVYRQARLTAKFRLVLGARVRLLNVFEEPLLQNAPLVWPVGDSALLEVDAEICVGGRPQVFPGLLRQVRGPVSLRELSWWDFKVAFIFFGGQLT